MSGEEEIPEPPDSETIWPAPNGLDRRLTRAEIFKLIDRVVGWAMQDGFLPQDAEEAAADIKSKVGGKGFLEEEYWNDHARVMAYIRGAVANQRKTYLRKAEREDRVFVVVADPHLIEDPAGLSPHEEMELEELKARVRAEVDALGPPYAEVLRRFFLDGEMHAQIAAAMDTTVGNSRVRLSRALVKFRESGKFNEGDLR